MDRPEQAARSDGPFFYSRVCGAVSTTAKAQAAVGWEMGANGRGTVACSADALPPQHDDGRPAKAPHSHQAPE